MIEAAEAEGRIEPGRTTIVEATRGNTGIALAFVCAAKGYDLVLTLPQGMSREREGLLRLYGARVEIIESMGGMNEAVDAARAMADDATTCSCPTSSPTRPTRRSTAARPARRSGTRLDGRVDVLVAGVGTGGTITGAGEVLKERNPTLPRRRGRAGRPPPCCRAAPPGPHKIQGIGAGFVPAGAQPRGARRGHRGRRRGRDRDGAPAARAREGVLAGISCGAALWAALEVAERPGDRAASGSSWCCRTPASATSRRRSSRPMRAAVARC